MNRRARGFLVLLLVSIFLLGIVHMALAAGEEPVGGSATAGTTLSSGREQQPGAARDDATLASGDGEHEDEASDSACAEVEPGDEEEQFRLQVEANLQQVVASDEQSEDEPDEPDAGTPTGLAKRIAKLEQQRDQRPDDGRILWKLALAYRAAGEYDKAISVLRDLKKLPGPDARVAVMLALCLRAAGDTQAALTELGSLESTVPGAVYAYRAILKAQVGEVEEAVEDMEEAVAAEPEQEDMYAKLGELYEKAGHNGVKVFVKGKKVPFDVEPFITPEGRTMVPLRAIVEALGADVKWDGESRLVTVIKGDVTIVLPVGSLRATVNGAEVALDVPAVIVGNRTMVPLRFLSESLGAQVGWFSRGQVVSVN
jgi:hypothetical protein